MPKDQTIKQYANMRDFCETTLREHFGMKADPLKVIGLAEEIGMQDLAAEFRQQLKDDKETQADIRAYHEPTLKTMFNH